MEIRANSWLHIVYLQLSFKFHIICPRLACTPITPSRCTYRGIMRRSSEPFTGNTASILVLSDRFASYILNCLELALHLFTPPIRVISIGTRALVSRIWLNHLREILVANHFINIFNLIHYSKNGIRY